MTNLERLKLELGNKEYYKDTEYQVFLNENNLIDTNIYVKKDNEINLLETVVNILETLANDVDLMRKIGTSDIATIDQASKYLSQRIYNLNKKILGLKEDKEKDTYSNIKPVFFG